MENKNDRTETWGALKEYMANAGKSQATVAKELAIGASTLSEYLNNKYTGDVEALEEAVRRYIAKHDNPVKRIDFCLDTTAKRKVFYVINTVAEAVSAAVDQKIKEGCKIGYIIGNSGVGKTWALNEYQRINPNTTVMVTAMVKDNETTIVRKIAKELGVVHEGRFDKIQEETLRKLTGTEMIIIIDEAEHLKPKALDILREIGDQSGAGLIIAGTAKLEKQLQSDAGGRDDYEYLRNRAVRMAKINKLEKKDIELIVTEYMKREEYSDVEIQKCVKAFADNVDGNARRLLNLLFNSFKQIRNKNARAQYGDRVTPELINAANIGLA